MFFVFSCPFRVLGECWVDIWRCPHWSTLGLGWVMDLHRSYPTLKDHEVSGNRRNCYISLRIFNHSSPTTKLTRQRRTGDLRPQRIRIPRNGFCKNRMLSKSRHTLGTRANREFARDLPSLTKVLPFTSGLFSFSLPPHINASFSSTRSSTRFCNSAFSPSRTSSLSCVINHELGLKS